MAPGSTARALWRSERPFLIALAGGVVVRALAMVAFPPAFVFSDGPYYLALVDHLVPLDDRTSGYGFLLIALSWFSRGVWLVALVQHLLGLVTAVLIYALLRRRAVRPRIAMLATLPVLYDGMELSLEHSVLTDVVFDLLIVLAVVVLAWRPAPRVTGAALAGVLLGLSACVRVVGEPVVIAGVLFCVFAAVGIRAKVLTALALCITFAVPLVAYASWYHRTHGIYAMTESSGRALYMRTTSFADCSRFTVPSYEQRLCPTEPVGQRPDPTFYGWHDPDKNHGLEPPPGVSVNQAYRDFAMRAIRAQPLDYAEVVTRDAAMSFFPLRLDAFGYDTAHKWSFGYYVSYDSSPWNRPAYAAHGGQQLTRIEPFAYLMAGYGYVVVTYGPLLLAMLALVVVGLTRRRPRAPAGMRSLAFLATALGMGLAWAPDVTAEFTWRYQLPSIVLVPVGAALAWTRLQDHRDEPRIPERALDQTRATPSTD
jgi:hypothetical protein